MKSYTFRNSFGMPLKTKKTKTYFNLSRVDDEKKKNQAVKSWLRK